ncbi:MAG: pyridoxal phosphate-dependent aminotransferase [Ignavibacteriales bacterium]|nr:pyridoxal phosphate-dependent aminotransferase [Ignavibacteriales bacterium]
MTVSSFHLKPLKAAKVSEISEATASSAVAPADRVNFHIGNPVQDTRLTSAYLRMVLGVDINREELADSNVPQLLHFLGWKEKDEEVIAFYRTLIQRSSPYTPRGGFSRTAPHSLVKTFQQWLMNQQEPLVYDGGETSGRREMSLGSGGIAEALRVFFHMLTLCVEMRPVHVFVYGTSLPAPVMGFQELLVEYLPDDEKKALEFLEHALEENPFPSYVVLGRICREETRRMLRLLSMRHPLYFVEANDAPNHLSLSREAKLAQRVIRFLSAGIFSSRFSGLSTVFVAGPYEYLELFDTIHFQLKGTPSASEIELLSYAMTHDFSAVPSEHISSDVIIDAPYEGFGFGNDRALPQIAFRTEERLGRLVAGAGVKLKGLADSVYRRTETIGSHIGDLPFMQPFDSFSGREANKLLEDALRFIDSSEWHAELTQNFLVAFTKHHPEYRLKRCCAASGSSRTALSLIGFHCGISDVIVPDLSWTYEHCFPRVDAVPLTEAFDLDAEAMIAAAAEKLAVDPSWKKRGAIVLNNPHNATGKVFSDSAIRKLITWLLTNGIAVIDDLSYQNVAPREEWAEVPTLRQTADELVRGGMVTSAQTDRVITVHSLSKTDCLAGARLSVVELRDEHLFEKFKTINAGIPANSGAIFLTYLFYRNTRESVRAYWRLRNAIFLERSAALQAAAENLPAERNPCEISIIPPTGSMYPLLRVGKLPSGLSLDWLASGLARQGIGLVPLSAFARTEKGFETARRTFRLTLGGVDAADTLLKKTRRVLIDLNHLIAEEAGHYNRTEPRRSLLVRHSSGTDLWDSVELRVLENAKQLAESRRFLKGEKNSESLRGHFAERLSRFRQRFVDRHDTATALVQRAQESNGRTLSAVLEREFHKEPLAVREETFRQRLFDRTVHPTQMYSIRSEAAWDVLIHATLRGRNPSETLVQCAAEEMLREYYGMNVAINSGDESQELIIDLDAMIAAELSSELWFEPSRAFVSFWGDWDGSTRPSGQGHRLVASVLIENVTRQSAILSLLLACEPSLSIDPSLRTALEHLREQTVKFTRLLNTITQLTHQLEKRYRGILPFNVRASAARRLGMSLHLARDPVTLLWHHNDRLERTMLDLRRKRREMLTYYFALNKKLRKELFKLIPAIQRNIHDPAIALEAGMYRDLLRRMVITPRIHQKMITAQDQFAIDTTVHNINEINEIAGRHGNPGMVLALQVSMAAKAEALISLDRKMGAARETILREHPDADLAAVRLVPLFEDLDAVSEIPQYLNRVWEYCLQSRRMNQEPRERFAEIVGEVFIAGSDLSQQIGQTAGSAAYRRAKKDLIFWLAERGLTDAVRLKMGSGEPMQRQGGYYAEYSGAAAFLHTPEIEQRLVSQLHASTRKSTEYATTPLMGVFAGGDLRTFQSAISEQLRYLSTSDLSRLLHHIRSTQQTHRSDLVRASESFAETRLKGTSHGTQELERLTIGTQEKAFEEFLPLVTKNFRQILYGADDDVVGIHLISYFIARSSPILRDRPTVRPSRTMSADRGQKILERIAETIPSSRYGSMLRAIAHNQAQTTVLGVNQLTTGLFRALDTVSRTETGERSVEAAAVERILPHLPVYEILQTLRLYHDPALHYLQRIERAFPAGNSAFLALREDNDAMAGFVGIFQKELLRRHGVDVPDFFDGDTFIPDLLPTLRPDLAVLLQPDLFNTNAEILRESIHGPVPSSWTKSVDELLAAPRKIAAWRENIWQILERPVFQRVQSFAELAISLHSLSRSTGAPETGGSKKGLKLSPDLSHFFRIARSDDDMRQFLAASLEYLSSMSGGMVEVPISIVRAMKEVERIAKIEEQVLLPKEQDVLRFYLLQIARLTGENG